MCNNPQTINLSNENQQLSHKLLQIYYSSQILSQHKFTPLFKILSQTNNTKIVQIPYTDDYLYRIIYYFLLYYSYESKQANSQSTINLFIKVISKIKKQVSPPISLINNIIKITNKQIQKYVITSLSEMKLNLNEMNIIQIISKQGLLFDYVLMTVLNSMSNKYGSIEQMIKQLGFISYSLSSNQIHINKFIIKFDRKFNKIHFQIQNNKLNQHNFLVNNSYCQSIQLLDFTSPNKTLKYQDTFTECLFSKYKQAISIQQPISLQQPQKYIQTTQKQLRKIKKSLNKIQSCSSIVSFKSVNCFQQINIQFENHNTNHKLIKTVGNIHNTSIAKCRQIISNKMDQLSKTNFSSNQSSRIRYKLQQIKKQLPNYQKFQISKQVNQIYIPNKFINKIFQSKSQRYLKIDNIIQQNNRKNQQPKNSLQQKKNIIKNFFKKKNIKIAPWLFTKNKSQLNDKIISI